MNDKSLFLGMNRVKIWVENNRSILVEVVVHIVAWSLYMVFWALNNAFQNLTLWHRFFYMADIMVFDLLIFYYFYILAIPRLLQAKKSGRFVVAIVLVIGFYPFIKYLADDLVSGYFPDETTVMSTLARAGFWQAYLIRLLSCLFVIMMAGIGKFTFDWFKNMRIRAELENQNLTSELAFLKSQINPHFLFNTLNNIHTLAYKKSDMAPESIMKLSDLMRYMIYESNVDYVPLDKEVLHLRSFIALQELRFKADNIVHLNMSGDHEQHRIAPLLLLPFVENAFKHGSNLNRSDAITINLECTVHQIRFEIQNETNRNIVTEKDEAGGIGMENIKRRLDLIYEDRFTLEVDDASDQYSACLTIMANG